MTKAISVLPPYRATRVVAQMRASGSRASLGRTALWAETVYTEYNICDESRLMDMSKKSYEVVFEICSKGNLMDFLDTITEIVNRIWEEKGCIVCSDVIDRNIFQHALNEWEPCMIVLGFKYQRSNRLHLIWELLRLTGMLLLHRQYEKRKEPVPIISARNIEILIWDTAYEEWERYPQLKIHEAGFIKYKADCLRPFQEAWKGWKGWNYSITDFLN